MSPDLFTPSGVRLRPRCARRGRLNWLLLPGGPGIGSESLHEVADALQVPGSIWMVDLPGDGSNRNPPGAAPDPFERWPQVLVEAAQAMPDVILVGHSTGGMYILSTPELEKHVRGLVLLDTAPDAQWLARFTEMTLAHPLPEVDAATRLYEADRRDSNIAAIAVASAPWNFTPAGVSAGRELLARMPYNSAAVEWSAAHFDAVYTHAWWPMTLPVLVLAGAQDRIVWQGGWDDPRFHGSNALFCTVEGGGHFPWIENAPAVAAAFDALADRIGDAPPR